jgi:uncharacterized protein
MHNQVLFRNKYLIIDGYNVINQWDDLRDLVQRDLSAARDSMISMVVNHISYTGERAYLVFDAYAVKSRDAGERITDMNNLRIIYTREKQTADSYIESIIGDLASDRTNFVRVVTSDWAEQQIILGSGGTRVTPREFLAEVESARTKIVRTIESKKHQGPSRSTLEDILDAETARKLENIGKIQQD